ncbi:uncharacterized protein N7459_001299 [Penicillium hispanicum]|uniref:uncharacterized protein n=1 Tax=Penicillium hispanicum TaxID=1080232 RepID=UPI0025419A3B|nr:uncharacterized protein N7459_001299 [Penicillium hispanicum]KAJ5595091.1 hypothetical protein N7459_001299 [Penicillium hispanicum]
MLSATPARQRSSLPQSRPPASARGRSTPRTTSAPDLPEYQPPEAPLTADSQRQLANLRQSRQFRSLQLHLQQAVDKLRDSAGDMNERLIDARVRYEKLKDRQRNGDEEDGDEQDAENEEYQRLAETERKVDAVTGRMEEKVRQMIDSETRLQGLAEAMSNIEKEEGEAQAAGLGTRQTRGQRQRQRRNRDGEDEDDGDHEDDADYEGTPEREARQRNAQNPPSQRLVDILRQDTEKWNGLSLTERYVERRFYVPCFLPGFADHRPCRYAGHNSYIGFYRTVHDSKFPGDKRPPLPHSSTWFAHLEDTNVQRAGQSSASGASRPQGRQTRHRRQPSPAGSDDIAIERERISLNCPLTLLPYREPMTSTKCPHSFEREAIQDMISQSSFLIHAPGGGRGRRIRAVKCPVCSIPLTADDLRPDPVLHRRVRRAQELEALEAEEEEESGRSGARPDRVMLASDAVDGDDAMDVDTDAESDMARVKSEPVHIKSERGRGNATTDSDEDDDEETGEGSDSDAEEEGASSAV